MRNSNKISSLSSDRAQRIGVSHDCERAFFRRIDMSYLKTEYVKNGDYKTPIDYYSCDITGNIICESDGWFGNEFIHISEEGVEIILNQFFKRYDSLSPFIIKKLEDKYTKRKKPDRYISKKIKKEIFHKYKHKCNYCGSVENLEIDHIIPVSKGGKNELKNLQVLCKSCNLKKSNK